MALGQLQSSRNFSPDLNYGGLVELRFAIEYFPISFRDINGFSSLSAKTIRERLEHLHLEVCSLPIVLLLNVC